MNKAVTGNSHTQKSKITCRRGNKRTFEDGCSRESSTGEGSVCQHILSATQFSITNKCEKFKLISYLSKIQDGKSKTTERFNKTDLVI